ncbi:putative calnexin [Cyclospora cayetanensis]|uniref:Calnexin n=1 Tax=Cyclospora cayetanensis TaxID=88456 RepID=A0A1D3CT65_9EIME|nr:putative calnexin [Cyclospora cayetanensis]
MSGLCSSKTTEQNLSDGHLYGRASRTRVQQSASGSAASVRNSLKSNIKAGEAEIYAGVGIESARPHFEESVGRHEMYELLKWRMQQRARLSMNQSMRNRDEDEDPPPDPTKELLLSPESEKKASLQASVDFGHNLVLTPDEKKELIHRVNSELAKIPRVHRIFPSVEGLLFVETFEGTAVTYGFLHTMMRPTVQHSAGQWRHMLRPPQAIEEDHGIMAASQGFRHAISTLLPSRSLPSPARPLVIQYELQQYYPDFECGGGYLTFFQSDGKLSLYRFNGDTQYTLRFGADQCGIRREILLKITRVLPIDVLSFNAVGLTFMAIDTGTLFDNIILSDNISAAQRFARETFWKRTEIEHQMASVALKTRSAVRKEIRRRQQEAEALNVVASISRTASYSSSDTGTRKSTSASEKTHPERLLKKEAENLHSGKANFSEKQTKQAILQDLRGGKATKSCRASSWNDQDTIADTILDGFLLLSSLLLG